LNKLYAEYKDRAGFLLVYIQEAHSTDGWQLPVNVKQNVLFADPRTDGERHEVADACVRKLKLDMPAVIDGVDNAVEQAYTGWPDRLYVLDKNGRVTHKSAPGPFGFEVAPAAEALRKAL
jgi:type I thyroxine 5'-deiodinase